MVTFWQSSKWSSFITVLVIICLNYTMADEENHHHESHDEMGFVTPLIPLHSISGHSGLLSSGMSGAALLNFKAAAVIAALLAIRNKAIRKAARRHKHKPKGWTTVEYVQDQGWAEPAATHGWSSNQVVTTGWSQPPSNGWASKVDKTRRRRRSTSYNKVHRPPTKITLQTAPPAAEALESDQLLCGLKLICELTSVKKNELKEDESLILMLFGDLAENEKKNCLKSNCPYGRDYMMEALREYS